MKRMKERISAVVCKVCADLGSALQMRCPSYQRLSPQRSTSLSYPIFSLFLSFLAVIWKAAQPKATLSSALCRAQSQKFRCFVCDGHLIGQRARVLLFSVAGRKLAKMEFDLECFAPAAKKTIFIFFATNKKFYETRLIWHRSIALL